MPAPTHFLTGAELGAERLDLLLHRAAALQEKPSASRALQGRAVALLFQKPSTRTRTALVFSRHVAAIGLRTGEEAELQEPAEHATVPVVNMLSSDPGEAVDGADAVYTDVWASMSDDESRAAARREALGRCWFPPQPRTRGRGKRP